VFVAFTHKQDVVEQQKDRSGTFWSLVKVNRTICGTDSSADRQNRPSVKPEAGIFVDLAVPNNTLSQKKYAPCCLIITLANVDRFSKFFYQLIRKKILYAQTTKISTSTAICCYTTLWNLKFPKKFTEFSHWTTFNCWFEMSSDELQVS